MIALQNTSGRIWYMAPTYRQAKTIAWKMLLKMLPEELIVKKNETELSVELGTGVIIELKGAENEDSLRGAGLLFAVLDEYQDMKPNVWTEIIRPTLLDTQGGALFIGTPKGYNHFFELFERAKVERGWEAFRFKTSDNPRIPEAEIEQTKKEYIEAGREDAYYQEYEAEFRKFSGLVYQIFARDIHVIEEVHLQPDWTYAFGIDFGYTNPTAIPFVGIDHDDNWYQFDEIYKTGLNNVNRYNLIKQKMGTRYFTYQTADSAHPDDIAELNKMGLSLEPVEKLATKEQNYISYKIQKFADRLRVREGTGRPKYFVTRNCENTIFEFESYRYDEKAYREKNAPERPLGMNDHMMDALGDLNAMYQGTDTIIDPNLNYNSGIHDDAW